jgi:hypothetical protein
VAATATKEPPGAGECDVQTASKLLMCTPAWLGRLAKDGWIKPLGRGRYSVIDVVQGYIKFLKDENRRSSKSASHSRVQDARAAQIELQMAREKRDLVDIEDMQAFLSETLGTLRSELSGVAAASSRDLAVRDEIEKNINAAIGRCRSAFDAAAQAMADRKPIAVDTEEADA